MSKAQDDHEERLARISDKIASLQSIAAETREEALVATEQLLEQALAGHRESLAASQRARADSAQHRAKIDHGRRRIHR